MSEADHQKLAYKVPVEDIKSALEGLKNRFKFKLVYCSLPLNFSGKQDLIAYLKHKFELKFILPPQNPERQLGEIHFKRL